MYQSKIDPKSFLIVMICFGVLCVINGLLAPSWFMSNPIIIWGANRIGLKAARTVSFVLGVILLLIFLPGLFR